MTTTILYDKDECPFCWRVRMAMGHCGLDYERRDYQTYEAAWAALTSQGTVPVLCLPDLVLTDSSVMLEYLNDRFGGLWPDSPRQRAEARSLALYGDSAVGKPVRDLIFERRDRPADVWDPQVIDTAMTQWRESLPRLDNALEGRDYFVDGVGITDYLLASRFGLGMAYGMPAPESVRLLDWFARMAKRHEFLDSAPAIVLEKLHGSWLP
jgi:glutathione S-transferase